MSSYHKTDRYNQYLVSFEDISDTPNCRIYDTAGEKISSYLGSTHNFGVTVNTPAHATYSVAIFSANSGEKHQLTKIKHSQ